MAAGDVRLKLGRDDFVRPNVVNLKHPLHSASAVARDGVAVKALTAARDGFSLNAAITQPELVTHILEHRAAVEAPGAGAHAPPGASLH